MFAAPRRGTTVRRRPRRAPPGPDATSEQEDRHQDEQDHDRSRAELHEAGEPDPGTPVAFDFRVEGHGHALSSCWAAVIAAARYTTKRSADKTGRFNRVG